MILTARVSEFDEKSEKILLIPLDSPVKVVSDDSERQFNRGAVDQITIRNGGPALAGVDLNLDFKGINPQDRCGIDL